METPAVIGKIDELIFHGDVPDVSLLEETEKPGLRSIFPRASLMAVELISIPMTLNPC